MNFLKLILKCLLIGPLTALALPTSISGFYAWLKPSNATLQSNASDSQAKIYGGREARKGEYAFAVFIYTRDLHANETSFCAGGILTATSVVTACHCLGDMTNGGPPVRVHSKKHYVAATLNISDTKDRQGMWSKHAVLHPKCYADHPIIVFDIGIIFTSQPFKFNYFVKPMKLLSTFRSQFQKEAQNLTQSHAICYVLGWGAYKYDVDPNDPQGIITSDSDVLRVVSTELIPNDVCERYLVEDYKVQNYSYNPNTNQSKIKGGHICAKPVTDGARPDFGDSGGPLVCPGNNVVGLLSHGYYVGQKPPGYLNFFTSLEYALNWLPMEEASTVEEPPERVMETTSEEVTIVNMPLNLVDDDITTRPTTATKTTATYTATTLLASHSNSSRRRNACLSWVIACEIFIFRNK